MENIKNTLSELVPELWNAVTDFQTKEAYSDWAKPFIVKIAQACLPHEQVDFKNSFNSEEESKDQTLL